MRDESDDGVEFDGERLPRVWRNSLGAIFRLIPPGSFAMGSPQTEPRRFADESRRLVTLTRPYYLSVYQTTQAEWRAVVGTNPSKNREVKRAPVENISYFDCVKFVDWLNSDEYLLELRSFLGPNWRYGLPTEAQWERACRAGTETAFYFGDVATGSEGNFGGLGENGKLGGRDGGGSTVEVGSYPPNPWGFFDMAGNVCEWTSDFYAEYSSAPETTTDSDAQPVSMRRDASDQRERGAAPQPERVSRRRPGTTDPTGPRTGVERVLRGGSWRSVPENCRSASRFNYLPTYRGDAAGVRIGIFPVDAEKN